MALVLKDRVRETSTTTGTGTFTLAGAVAGFQSFSAIGTGNTTYYTIADASGNWEVGLGTFTSPNLLSRDKVLESSNSNNLVNFASTSKDVFVSYPSEAVCNGISVKSYGAKGDGTTDDTAAIQNCITQNPNRKIFFPKGKYRITDTIVINPLYGYVLEGEGYDPCSPHYASTPDFTNIWMDNNTFVDAFNIVWDYSTYPYPPFREILFRNLTISGTPCTYASNLGSGHGVYADYVVLRMENVCLANHGKSGLYLAQGFSSVFTACLFNYNTENGVYMPGNNNQVGFTGCQFLGNSRVDNFTDPNGDYVGAAGCMLDGSSGTNLTVTFTNCEFSINGLNDRFGETTQVSAAHGIYARNTTGLSLIGCYAEYNYGAFAQDATGTMYLSDNINIDSSCMGVYITGLFSQTSDINIINTIGLVYENGNNYDTAFTIKANPSSSAVSRPPIIRISADTSNQSFFRIYGNSWGTNTTTTFTNAKQVDQFYSDTDPTGTGTHKVGDICWSTGTLTGSNPIGWICTTAPNTFKAFGGNLGTVTSITASTTPVNGLSLSGGTITGSGTIGITGTLNLSSPPAIGETTANTGSFTTLSTSSAITLTGISDPSAPTNTNTSIYSKSFGGYPTLAARNALNTSFGLQSALWAKNVQWWTTTAAINGLWINASGTGNGTYANANPTLGGTKYQTIRRSTYANLITTLNQTVGVLNGQASFYRGNVAGQGGFFFYTRCGFDTWTNGGRFFAGMSISNAITTDPSTVNQTVGFCVDAADNGAISFLTRGAAATKASTGLTIVTNKGYDCYIYCAPNSSQYTWQIIDINTGTSVTGTATLNLPTNTQIMFPEVVASNAALTTAAVIKIGVAQIYVESDY